MELSRTRGARFVVWKGNFRGCSRGHGATRDGRATLRADLLSAKEEVAVFGSPKFSASRSPCGCARRTLSVVALERPKSKRIK
jgi:hypothetical protein